MGLIYRNCLLNIAAVSSEDGDGGCFADRSPESLQACKFTTSREPLYVHPIDHASSMVLGNRWVPKPRPILWKRGWVIQERALAPRSLLYMAKQLDWECLECRASEVQPSLSPYDSSLSRNLSVKRLLTELIHNPNGVDSDRWLKSWWSIVEKYTDCNLTVSEDRRIAITGLVNVIQQMTGKKNIGGLWSFNLIQELCWEALGPSQRLLAPSWSWLSVNTQVWRPLDRRWSWEKGIACIRSPSNSNFETWDETALELVLEGPKVRFSSKLRDDDPSSNGPAHEDPSSHNLSHTYNLAGMDLSGWHEWFDQPRTRAWWRPDREFDPDVQLWALQIYYRNQRQYKMENGKEWRSRWCLGLVVTPSLESDGVWSRLGCFTIGIWDVEDAAGALETITTERSVIRLQ